MDNGFIIKGKPINAGLNDEQLNRLANELCPIQTKFIAEVCTLACKYGIDSKIAISSATLPILALSEEEKR